MAHKCKTGYKLQKGKCVKVKGDSFFSPDSGVKKGVLWFSLIAVILSGILGATFFLFGTFNDTTLKILSTTAIAGVGAMLMLGFSRFKDRVISISTIGSSLFIMVLFLLNLWEITDLNWGKVWLTLIIVAVSNILALISYADKNMFLKFAGPLTTVIAGVMWSGALWEWFNYGDTFMRWVLIISVVAFSLAHVSLINTAKGSKDGVVRSVFWAVVCLITIVTGMLVYLIFNIENVQFTDMFFRVLGFVGILDVAGSIALPILKKVRG
jgi:hypothetical protein